MVLHSKRAMVAGGSERGNKLPQTGRERAIAAHDSLRKCAQMISCFRAIGEEMPDLRIFLPGCLNLTQQIGAWSGERMVFNVREKHGFHFGFFIAHGGVNSLSAHRMGLSERYHTIPKLSRAGEG